MLCTICWHENLLFIETQRSQRTLRGFCLRIYVANLLNLRAFPKNAVGADPAIDAASVVADLKALVLNCFDKMKVLVAVHFAKDDIAHLQRGRVHGFDRAKLAGLDLAGHGIAPGSKLNG